MVATPRVSLALSAARPTLVVATIAIVLAALTAAALVAATSSGVVVGVGSAVLLIVIAHLNHIRSLFLGGLAVILTGYAFLGKGFAYLGAPPIYVGEAVFALAVLATVAYWRRAWLTRLHVVLLAFMLWGLARTVPFVAIWGVDALRDAVLWGYAAFAIALSMVIERRHVEWLIDRYRFAIPFFLAWLPVATLLWTRAIAPNWVPGALLSLVYVKGGDMSVHLAGVGSFILLGLYARGPGRYRPPEQVTWALWLIGVALASVINRGGMLAILFALGITMFMAPSRRIVPLLTLAVTLLVAAVLWNPVLRVGLNREVSLGQLTQNVRSIVGQNTGNSELLAKTANWRLDWWRKIVDYTVFGPYRWTGKGFGVNLTIDDGITFGSELRSPHNSHMTVLARMGVPGATLWLLFQLGWATGMYRAFSRAARRGDVFWARVDAWLLAYWLAIVVNTSFDVYLEGPQGGIWFWAIIGLGLAAMRMQQPQVSAPVARLRGIRRFPASVQPNMPESERAA